MRLEIGEEGEEETEFDEEGEEAGHAVFDGVFERDGVEHFFWRGIGFIKLKLIWEYGFVGFCFSESMRTYSWEFWA